MNALFSNASIALNSVAGEEVDFGLATVGVSPTVIIASSRTMSDYHDFVMQPQAGAISSFGRWVQTRTLDAGNMPSKNFFSQLARIGPTAELSLDHLRLLCISHRIDAPASSQLTTKQLTDIRVFTDARIVYALTGPGIAGAIAQTNVFDYRRKDGPSHFGSPLSSTELTLTGVSEGLASETPEGEVRLTILLTPGTFANLHFFYRSRSLDLLSWVERRHFLPEPVSARTTPLSFALRFSVKLIFSTGSSYLQAFVSTIRFF